MSLRKTKKRRKMSRMRGTGTHGGGARKKRKKSGHRGGAGMSGTGKRSDHKKTLVTALYGHGYFGKQGITSKKTQKDKRKRLNIDEVDANVEKYGKKSGDKWEISLSDYKILGGNGNYKVKNKLIIKAKEASAAAIEKIKNAGGEIIILKKKSENIGKEDESNNMEDDA